MYSFIYIFFPLVLSRTIMAPVLNRARKKSSSIGLASPEKQWASLAAFVGVPLPGTGAWTGAMGAFLLGMPTMVALSSIFTGVVSAGLIMSAIVLAASAKAVRSRWGRGPYQHPAFGRLHACIQLRELRGRDFLRRQAGAGSRHQQQQGPDASREMQGAGTHVHSTDQRPPDTARFAPVT